MKPSKTQTVFISSILFCAQVAVADDSIFPAKPVPLVEASVGAAVAAPQKNWDGGVTSAAMVDLAGEVNIPFVSAEGRIQYANIDGQNQMQVEANGSILVLQVQDFFYRLGGPNGDQMRALAGLGWSFNITGAARLALSVGATAIQWQRPQANHANSVLGGYVGGALKLRIWRFRDELRVGFYAGAQSDKGIRGTIDQISHDGSAAMAFASKFKDDLKTGFIASNRLSFQVFDIANLFSFSPELVTTLNQLPDGTEFQMLLGVRGSLHKW